jgi:hypothetical protein
LGTQLDSGELAGCHTRSPALSPVSTTTDTRPSGVHPGVRRSWTRPCRDSAPPPACPWGRVRGRGVVDVCLTDGVTSC